MSVTPKVLSSVQRKRVVLRESLNVQVALRQRLEACRAKAPTADDASC